MKLLFLGRLADLAGGRERDVDLPAVHHLGELREWLGRSEPRLSEALSDPAVTVLVNDVARRDDPGLAPGDEVAFLPIPSGG